MRTKVLERVLDVVLETFSTNLGLLCDVVFNFDGRMET